MATDFREIHLTDDQKRRVAQLAEQTGKPWRELVEERLSAANQLPAGQVRDEPDNTCLANREAWLADFDAWISTRRSYNPNFDDSRDSIYPDRW